MTKSYCDKCTRECTKKDGSLENTFMVKRFDMYTMKGSILCLCDGCLLEFIDCLPDDEFSKEIKAYALSCK